MPSRRSRKSARHVDPPWRWFQRIQGSGVRADVEAESTVFGIAASCLALEMVSDAVYLVDRMSLRVLKINHAVCEMSGREKSELVGLRLPELFDDESQEMLRREMTDSHSRGSRIFALQRKHDGEWKPVELTIRLVDEPQSAQVLVVARDLSDRYRADQMARTPRFRDPLTGLADRRAFDQMLRSAVDQSKRSGQRFAVFFVDMNDFRLVNEAYGHTVGDDVLKEVARRLEAATREEDLVARYGGDEFVILVTSCGDEKSLLNISARINASLNEPVWVDDVKLVVSASIGMAQDLGTALDPREVIEQADDAMYCQKARYRRKSRGLGLRAT